MLGRLFWKTWHNVETRSVTGVIALINHMQTFQIPSCVFLHLAPKTLVVFLSYCLFFLNVAFLDWGHNSAKSWARIRKTKKQNMVFWTESLTKHAQTNLTTLGNPALAAGGGRAAWEFSLIFLIAFLLAFVVLASGSMIEPALFSGHWFYSLPGGSQTVPYEMVLTEPYPMWPSVQYKVLSLFQQ